MTAAQGGRLVGRPETIRTVPNHMNLLDINGSTSLTFYCGELPADEAITAAGHEPNGYFWEGMVKYIAPALTGQVELDSEADMFAAYGDKVVLRELRGFIDPLLDDRERVSVAIREAEASGFQLDD